MQEIHCKMDPIQVTAGNRQITRVGGPIGQNNGIELFLQFVGRDIFSHFRIRFIDHAFLFDDIDTTLHDPLVEFHIRNAIHHQSA